VLQLFLAAVLGHGVPILLSIASKFRPHNLNQALGWLLASVIVPLLLGALVLLVAQSRQEREQAQKQLSALAQTLVQAVDRELDHGRAQLEVLAASPVVDAQDWRQLHRFAGDVARRRPGSLIGLAGPDGQQLFNTAMAWGAPQPNLWQLAEQHREVIWEGRPLPLSSQNLTREVFARSQVVYSDLYYGLSIKRPTLAVSVPVVREGQVRFALTLSFPPALLEQLIRSAVSTPGMRIAVVDRRGVVVASNAAAAARVGDRITPISIAPGSSAGNYESQTRDGVPIRGAYAISANNGFLVRVALPRDDVFSFSRSATAGWLALVAGSLAASMLLAGVLGRRLARPLRELGQAARAGEPPGDQARSGIEEIDVLAQALRAGAEAERQRRAELVVSTQRAQAETALRRADRQKDEFLATLSHELRNPLAPIRSAVELIRRCAPSDVRVQRARDIIDRQVAHLTRLVDDLLEVSRITLGTVQLRKEVLDLRDVALSAAESVRPAVEMAGLTMTQQIAGLPVMVDGDATRLAQCIVNLLNNAVKFTPSGGCVTLRVELDGATAGVEVTDNGIGIARASLQRIFEPFVQERMSGSHGNTGLGIGLALTRKLLALHGGMVSARSAGPGQGSTFRIELPVLTAAAAEVREPAVAAAEGAGARVLVVDDNMDSADMLSEMLTLTGFESTVAYDGQNALREVHRNAPDAVLLDIGLPDMDGYEVCRRIRQGAGKQPIVIALTGWGQQTDREQAQAAGFDAHLTKPAEPERLVALLKKLVPAAQA
jgi:signal transduction histidine kinase/ActR/RegA family two-component response regulator